MIPALAHVSTLHAPLESDVADYAAGACRTMEVWLGKVESYLDRRSIDDVKRLLDEHQVSVPAASFQGGLLDSQDDARREHWDHFVRRLELCRELDIGTLVIAADIAGPVSQQLVDRVKGSLAKAAEQAGEHGVRLALEFQAKSTLCNNLQTAAALVAEAASPHLGICLDAFHLFTGPSKTEDLGHLTADNLFHVQLCDLAGQPRELATDADRILPGDGDLPLELLIEHLRAIDYERCVSIELMNPHIWQVPPLQFGEIGMTALRKVLGFATMTG